MQKRIQVYLRQRGKTISEGNEFKTEDYEDRDALIDAIRIFVEASLDIMEDGEDDSAD